MTALVLGPLLRSVEGDAATVWVELDAPATVTVTAGAARGEARTTAVDGRHHALVVVEGLPPAAVTPYEVAVDGEVVWPEPASPWPASVVRTEDRARPLRVLFGSCRLEAPLTGHWENGPEDDPPGHGVDALEALAEQLRDEPPERWPDLLALLGDQVYADLVVHDSPVHTGPDAPPAGTLRDLDDYALLYRRTWGHPPVRWLLSTVPTQMVFDDHDVVDDWNLSERWLADIAREPWWDARIDGGFVSYWLYQHWANLTPSQLAADDLARAVAATDDASALLHGRVPTWRLDTGDPTAQHWSTVRDLAGTATARLVLADTRASRHLVEGERAVVDAAEMAWVAERSRVDRDGVDHLLLGSSLPWLLPRGVHDVERWGEALGSGRWGRRGRHLAEKIRADNDLEHWPSFGRSFDDLAELLTSVARGDEGRAPASALVLSGDVHFSYLAPADLGDDRATATVAQLVSSPLRHGVPAKLRRTLQVAASPVGAWGGRVGRLTAAGWREPVRWSLTGGPWFGNGLAALELDGRAATVTFHRAERAPDGRARLAEVHTEPLTP